MRKPKIYLKNVTKNDYWFLYDLLLSRDPIANISHLNIFKLPSYNEHVKFVLSKPYSIWKIIYYNYQRIGSVYLTREDSIGLWLKRDMQFKGLEEKILKIFVKEFPRPVYYTNVAPTNKKWINILKKYGFKPIEYTYELRTKSYKAQKVTPKLYEKRK